MSDEPVSDPDIEDDSTSEAAASIDPDESASTAVGRFVTVGENVQRYLLWGAFVLSLLFIVLAAFNLYFQVGSIINTWIAAEFRPMFQAAFNLVVLLVAVYVAAVVANRLEVLG